MFQECTGEYWPFLHNTGLDANQYLQQIDGILSISNENNEKLWYVRGKTLNGENRGKIYRSNNQPEFDLSTQSAWQRPHGGQSNTCTQYNNNFGNGRSSKYNSGERNNNCYVNHNINANTDHNNNRNYAPRNNMQLVNDTKWTRSTVFFYVFLCTLFVQIGINCCFFQLQIFFSNLLFTFR